MIADVCTGAAIATNALENKTHTALAHEVGPTRAHRVAAPLGGTQDVELDMSSMCSQHTTNSLPTNIRG
jgi:hypothetical protein